MVEASNITRTVPERKWSNITSAYMAKGGILREVCRAGISATAAHSCTSAGAAITGPRHNRGCPQRGCCISRQVILVLALYWNMSSPVSRMVLKICQGCFPGHQQGSKKSFNMRIKWK